VNQAHNVLSFRLGFRPTCSLLILKFRHGESWEMLAVWALAPVLSHRSTTTTKSKCHRAKAAGRRVCCPVCKYRG